MYERKEKREGGRDKVRDGKWKVGRVKKSEKGKKRMKGREEYEGGGRKKKEGDFE